MQHPYFNAIDVQFPRRLSSEIMCRCKLARINAIQTFARSSDSRLRLSNPILEIKGSINTAPAGRRFSPFSRPGQVPELVELRRRACRLDEIVNRGPAAIQFRRLLAATLYVRVRKHTYTSARLAAQQSASSEKQFARFPTRSVDYREHIRFFLWNASAEMRDTSRSQDTWSCDESLVAARLRVAATSWLRENLWDNCPKMVLIIARWLNIVNFFPKNYMIRQIFASFCLEALF